MTDISSDLREKLVSRAEQYYPDVLPYHNWDHALDMMTVVARLADQSINPEIRNKRNLLMVTAAWHDADYARKELGQFVSKEERSAYLAIENLPELSTEDADTVFKGIIDTTVSQVPKHSLFGEVTHAADVGYLAAPTDHFMTRLTLMREEWGAPSWEIVAGRTMTFGQTLIDETREFMPKVLSEADVDDWIARIEHNLQYLREQVEARTLGA